MLRDTLAAESRGGNTRKIDGSTCIRDTAPCRTDEPLGRLTFFHAAAAPQVAPLITNTVPSFSLVRSPCTTAPSFSFSPTARPSHSLLHILFPRSRSLSHPLFLPVRSPISFTLAQRPFFHPLSLRVYHSFPQQCRRRAEAILRDSTGVPYYPRKIFNKRIELKQKSLVVEEVLYGLGDQFHLPPIATPLHRHRADHLDISGARFSIIRESQHSDISSTYFCWVDKLSYLIPV